jgi:hypothetical protein
MHKKCNFHIKIVNFMYQYPDIDVDVYIHKYHLLQFVCNNKQLELCIAVNIYAGLNIYILMCYIYIYIN